MIDERTGREFGDQGTYKDAVDFILHGPCTHAPGEDRVFLECWESGDLSEWPEFYEWLSSKENNQ